mmetsp:Transcript_6800/g.20660  ORF Transcript_6800/g.20660 Transcript_6800/m.20660 type:complete len:164 (-) Transcript_6800:611-1102(-)
MDCTCGELRGHRCFLRPDIDASQHICVLASIGDKPQSEAKLNVALQGYLSQTLNSAEQEAFENSGLELVVTDMDSRKKSRPRTDCIAVRRSKSPLWDLFFPVEAELTYTKLLWLQVRLRHSVLLISRLFIASREWDSFYGDKVRSAADSTLPCPPPPPFSFLT